jgi:hypothetical protein
MTHSSNVINSKVAELRNLTIDEIACAILTLEIELDECGGKLQDAEERAGIRS